MQAASSTRRVFLLQVRSWLRVVSVSACQHLDSNVQPLQLPQP